jgi:phage-related protein
LAPVFLSCGIKTKEHGIALSRIDDVVYVLHCFEKKSREMPRRDFERAKRRFKAVKAHLAEEKQHEKRG